MADSQEVPLPDFDDPPVVETVLSVQFEKLSAMQAGHPVFTHRITHPIQSFHSTLTGP
jgi:hypothetical protein